MKNVLHKHKQTMSSKNMKEKGEDMINNDIRPSVLSEQMDKKVCCFVKTKPFPDSTIRIFCQFLELKKISFKQRKQETLFFKTDLSRNAIFKDFCAP